MRERAQNAISFISLQHQNLHKKIVKIFEDLSYFITHYYWWFILIPVAISCVGALGIIELVPSRDYESISLPGGGQWSEEKKSVDNNFKKTTEANVFRTTRLGQYLNVIITSKDESNILSPLVWDSILKLDEEIQTSKIVLENNTFSYQNICRHWRNKCFPSMMPVRPDIITTMGSLINQAPHLLGLNVTMPDFIPSMEFYIGYNLGSPNFTEQGNLLSAKSISLYYLLQSDTKEQLEISMEWERAILERLSKNTKNHVIDIFPIATRTINDEVNYANDHLQPLLALCGVFMVIFVIASASMSDWVRSKIILSLMGIVSVVMATGTAFGILTYCKVPFIGINYATIFLMLGIGIDDMFVFLAAWRNTQIQDSVESRMKSTYGHACVSVTMTSLTNGLAFFMGTFTNIKIIEIFSIYSCFSIMLTYIYFVTFFGGCLALSAIVEGEQRHSVLCCLKVEPKSKAGDKKWYYRWFASGGINPLDPYHPVDNQPQRCFTFIGQALGKPLATPAVRKVSFVVYGLYVILAIYGLSNLEMEANPNRVSFQNETARYFEKYDQYFRDKPAFVQIVLTQELDYGNSSVQQKILNLHDTLEQLPFVKGEFTVSWLKDWIHYSHNETKVRFSSERRPSLVQLLKQNIDYWSSKNVKSCKDAVKLLEESMINSSETFPKKMNRLFHLLKGIPCDAKQFLSRYLPEKFLDETHETVDLMSLLFWAVEQLSRSEDMYKLDVVFNATTNRISASRFLIVVENGSDAEVQRTLREVAAQSDVPGVKIFNMKAVIADEVKLVKDTTVRSMLSTTLVVVFVSLVLIPNPICSLWVAFSIASIEAGVAGLMALWGVRLNAVSMVNLIMCVGFSVDFSAHMSYAFLSAPAKSPHVRVQQALHQVGVPILLGGLSTIVGILPICLADSVVFLIFFKVVLIVVVLGVLHSLVFLPAIMSVFCGGAGRDENALYQNSTSSQVEFKSEGETISVLDDKSQVFSIKQPPLPMYLVDQKQLVIREQPCLVGGQFHSGGAEELVLEVSSCIVLTDAKELSEYTSNV